MPITTITQLRARLHYGEERFIASPALLTRGNVSWPFAERVIHSPYSQLHINPKFNARAFAAIEVLRAGLNAQVREK